MNSDMALTMYSGKSQAIPIHVLSDAAYSYWAITTDSLST